MNHYIDIKIKKTSKVSGNRLMNLVFTKLHKALVKLKSQSIGVSFPNYRLDLGDLLRIHSDEHMLKELKKLDWLSEVAEYCDLSEITKIPEKVQHRTVFRKRTTMTNSKLNRLIKRNSINDESARKYKAKMFSQSLDNPYLELKSSSTGSMYRKFIEFGDLMDSPAKGNFDSFGLSKSATIPWF